MTKIDSYTRLMERMYIFLPVDIIIAIHSIKVL